MKPTNTDLQDSLKRMMARGTPLNDILQKQKPKKTTKRKPKQAKQPTHSNLSQHSEPIIRKKHWRDEDYEIILEQAIFIFDNRPYEATYRHNTVTLLDLTTFQSSITPTLWEDEQTQHLHHYLQVNWEQLPIHDTEDLPVPTFTIDSYFTIKG